MNKHITKILAVILISLSSSSWAVEHPIDIHHHTKMIFVGFGPVDKTYGYLNIVTNEEGKGMINVMFSNGRQTDWVKFNARVSFLDESGAVIKETNVYRWVGSAGTKGAAETKVTTPLKVSEFDAIEVEFYLTETQDTVETLPAYKRELAYKEITRL
jgi:hypothetical protein